MMTDLSPILAFVFASPWLAAVGAGAVAIPIAIHLLSRMRRTPVRWGAMRFLELAYKQQRNRLRLESWLLLVTRCLIVLIAGLALASPVLSGSAAQWLGLVDPTPRVVVLVMDDSLAAAAMETADRSRFDRHRRQALAVVDGLPAGDQVAVWAAGRPARAVIEQPTADRDAVRRALEAMQPRYSRTDLPAALAGVAQMLAERGDARQQRVAVFSDFPMGADYLAASAPPEAAVLGEYARLIVTRPSPSVGNVQAQRLQPRRSVVLTGGTGGGATGTVSVAATVRRLGAGSGPATGSVRLELLGVDGQTLYATTQTARWAAGQAEATLNAELPLDAVAALESGFAIVRATVAASSADNLAGDNTAWAVLGLRRQLRVGVVNGGGAAGGSVAGDAIAPRRWVEAALRPSGGRTGGTVTTEALGPGELGDDTLEPLDAVFVLRPELVGNAGWSSLAAFAEGGGLVWLTPSSGDGSVVWPEGMRRAFGVDWRVGLEPVTLSAVGGAGVGLDLRTAPPEPLELLAADWPDLLRPVRVSRSLDLLVPEAEAWIALAEADDGAGDERRGARRVLLAGRAVGQGALLLLATPLDTGWTNLPTKPLFVPLVHEALRGVIGSPRRALDEVAAGDRPLLPAAYAGQLAPLTAVGQAPDPIPLIATDGGTRPDTAIEQPGVYASTDAPGARPVAVNVQPVAGDTRPVGEAQLGQWLAGVGSWRFFEPGETALSAGEAADSAGLAWALLWVLLALLLLETVLARWVSHARRGGDAGVTRRVLGTLRHVTLAREQASSSSASRGRAA